MVGREGAPSSLDDHQHLHNSMADDNAPLLPRHAADTASHSTTPLSAFPFVDPSAWVRPTGGGSGGGGRRHRDRPTRADPCL